MGSTRQTGAERERDERRSSYKREIVSTILLSLATVASTWSAYQSTRWSGEQATLFNEATSARTSSESRSITAVQETTFDASMFVQYAAALIEDNQKMSSFLHGRFRPEMKVALDAWRATKPLQNAEAPPSPLSMPEYKSEATRQARELARVADEKFEAAKAANHTADKYVLLSVVFTSVLFFGGVGGKAAGRIVGNALIGFSALIFLVASVALMKFPFL